MKNLWIWLVQAFLNDLRVGCYGAGGLSLIANYGYQDGSGIYFISIDTEKCDGCGKCVEVCPYKVLELVSNEYDPFDDDMVLRVVPEQRNKLKYSCAPCKSVNDKNGLHCIQACPREAIRHSW